MSADMEELRRKGSAVAELLTAADERPHHLRQRHRPAARARRPDRDPGRRRARRARTPSATCPAARASSPRSRAAARARSSSTARSPASASRPSRSGMSRRRSPRPRRAGPRARALMELLTAARRRGATVAELGIGTNEKAKLTGNVLEDEKLLGTAHVAFGASEAIGGRIQVPVHLDCVVMKPTVSSAGRDRRRRGRLPALRHADGGTPLLAVPNFSAGPPSAGADAIGADRRRPRRAGRDPRPAHRRRPQPLRLHARRRSPRRPRRARSRREPPARDRGDRPARARRAPTRGSARSTSARSSGPSPTSQDGARELALAVAEQLAALGLPVFLYGELASSDRAPRARLLPRAAASRALAAADARRRARARPRARPAAPVRGRRARHRAGAARRLQRRARRASTLEAGREIAAALRESGGGLPGVRAMAIELAEGTVQISTNVHDPVATPLGRGRRARPSGSPLRARRRAGRGGARRADPGGRARRLPRARPDPRLRPAPAHGRGAPRGRRLSRADAAPPS